MSAVVTGWVLEHSPVIGAARLVLIVLADHSDSEGRNAYPSVRRIAHQARCSDSTVHRVMRELEAAGHVVREGVSERRTVNYRVAFQPSHGRTLPASEGSDPEPRPSDTAPVDPPTVGPEPTTEPSREPTKRNARTRDADQLPDDFPPDLQEHAVLVARVLAAVAEQHNAREVTLRGVGLAMLGYPGRRYVQIAHDLASWAQSPPRPIQDATATYRTFLNREPAHAGTEPLGAAVVAGQNGRRGRSSVEDYMAIAAREDGGA